ncbi:MAG: tripartite tricarboxylate transporter substrate-binding protein, partial [Burkholderiales bacterium]
MTPRQHYLTMTAAALAAAGFMPTANAQKYPARPLRMICPSPPGGSVDYLARVFAQHLAARFGVPTIVDNRVGASAVIASEILVKAPPDGHTLMMAYSSHATNPIFMKSLPYDTLKDFSAVAHVGYIPLLLVVHPSTPATSAKALITLAKAKPGQLTVAAGAQGGGPSMAAILLNKLAGVNVVQVPYKGNAPALVDVLGGQVTMMFDPINTSLPLARAGRLRMLAVTGIQRAAQAPELPTMIEAGLPGFDVRAWFAIVAPANTPRDII